MCIRDRRCAEHLHHKGWRDRAGLLIIRRVDLLADDGLALRAQVNLLRGDVYKRQATKRCSRSSPKSKRSAFSFFVIPRRPPRQARAADGALFSFLNFCNLQDVYKRQTITRVNKCLCYGADGYKLLLERAKEEK